MELQIGDRLADETGEWEVSSRPYTTAGGKTAHVRVQRVGQPDVTDLRTWGAHERINVKRALIQWGKVQIARTDVNGHYAMRGLRSGKYYVFAKHRVFANNVVWMVPVEIKW